jgi:type VI secretion system protein ImpM
MSNSVGYFGKFPELGDFVQRRLPGSFLDGWDEWLQGSVFTSKEMLGQDWLRAYLSSPVWRFCIATGVCGESPWCGLLMPSVDRVGRYFPLTLACQLPADCNLLHIGMQGQPWFNAAEEVLVGVLQSTDFNLERFDDIVQGLGTMDVLADYSASSTDVGYGSSWRIPLGEEGHLGPAVLGLTHQLLLQHIGAYSIWWSMGSDQVAPSFLLSRGMPVASNYAGMLNGDWASGTWMEMPVTITTPSD